MKIRLSHGSGGAETRALIESVFLKYFANEFTDLSDSAVLPFSGKKLAYTTDSYVVSPLFFSGGDIGKIAVTGTVNDLLTTGGRPLYLSASFIIEENSDTETLEKIAKSMRDAADEAGVIIVTGDTKVVEGGGGIFITTSGIGEAGEVSIKNIAAGDIILINGNLGDHHACIISSRLGIKNNIKTDAAPLTGMVGDLIKNVPVRGLRDITRGGLATVLHELSAASGLRAEITEELLPISNEVSGLCKMLGLDPLYMANEGKMLVVVPGENEKKTLSIMKKSAYGENSAVIGRFTESKIKTTDVVLKTKIGGSRKIAPLIGEGLPRIC